ncbi:MAG: hypothetical protein WCB02_09515, partial [Bradyrhizobium sp.]
VASASPGGGGFFSSLAHKVGLGGPTADTTAATPPPPTPAPSKPRVAEAKHPDAAKPAPKAPETRQAANHPPLKPSAADTSADQPSGIPAGTQVVSGAQPIVQANSFENRFSAVK